MKNRKSGEQRRRELAETVWLQYFNRVLHEKGVISETERERMLGAILRRRPGRD